MLRGGRRAGKCLLEERDADSLRAADARSVAGVQARPFTISANRLSWTGLTIPSCARPLTAWFTNAACSLASSVRAGGRAPNARPNAARTFRACRVSNRFDTRAVLAVRKVHVQLAQERRDRHPEIIPHDDDRLDSRAVALPDALDQFGPSGAGWRVQPLLELIEDEQEFAAGRKRLAPADRGE